MAGFVGVDVFYVLSGFLITGLLLSEFERRGSIGLAAFWLRRARRLLPALLLVLVAVTLMVRFAEPAGMFPGYRSDALAALFYVSNWWQIATSGNYFASINAAGPLTHTWSLAVEEQFYLVWPLVVLAVLHLSSGFVRGVRVLSWPSRPPERWRRRCGWRCSSSRVATPPGSTSAPTPTPSRS